MDDLTEDTLPDHCIILTPEELSKLGVKLEPSLTSSKKNDSNSKGDKKQQIDKFVGNDNHTRNNLSHMNTTDNSAYNSKGISNKIEDNNFKPEEKIESYKFADNSASCSDSKNSLTPVPKRPGRPKKSLPALMINVDQRLAVKTELSLKCYENKCRKVKSTTKLVSENINSHSSPDVGAKISAINIVLPKQKMVGAVNHPGKNLSHDSTTNKGHCSEEGTKNKTKENSESFNNGGVAEEKVNVPKKFDNYTTCLGEKNVQSPVLKQREMSKQSLIPVANDSIDKDHELQVNKSYLKLDIGKNKAVERPLVSSPDISEKCSLADDSSGKLDPGCSKTCDAVVQKGKRGRPKKSLFNALDHNTVNNGIVDILNTHSKNISGNTSELPEMLEHIKSKERRKGRINKIVDDDLNFNSDSNDDSDSEPLLRAYAKKKRKRRIRRVTDSDASFESVGNSSNDEFVPKQKLAKTENSKVNSTKKISILNNVSVSYDKGNESILPVENTTPKKRGRPKKNSLEENKMLGTSTAIKQNEIDESVITSTSKRGRKRKEVNYSLLENPDLTVPQRHNMKIYSQQQIVHCDSPPNFKIKTEVHSPLQEPVKEEENNEQIYNEAAEGNSIEKQYKWTGNVTKAINQMFSAIKNVSITDSSHDPLLGKTKRKGKGIGDLLDKDGSTVCMVCNETIPNPQWPKHKRKVHYNLAWRKGEVCLELSNEQYVLKTLKELIRERESVKCNRCSEKFKNAKKFATHLEVCNGVVNSSGFVTCAVCKFPMEKGSWHYHNYRQHNNLAWRDGDPPLDLEDQDSVLRILNTLYKARKPLHCEKCGLQKKSVLGYLSHKSTCCKTGEELENMKVPCDLCGKRILPVSMDYHLKSHEAQKAKSELIESNYFDVNIEVSGKRRAAKQALQVINSIKGQATEESKYYVSQCDFLDSFVSDILRKTLLQDSTIKCIFAYCSFKTEEVTDMVNHLNSCEKKPNNYFVCKVCLYCFKEETEIHEHIRTEHDKSFKGDVDTEFQIEYEQNTSEDDALLDDEDRERKRIRLIGKQKIFNQSNNRVKPFFLLPYKQSHDQILYQHAYRWMLEFCETNYKFNLYQSLRNVRPWQVLGCDILSNYLPKNPQSCDIAGKLITIGESPNFDKLSFKKLDLFEVAALYEDDITIYCGGPISSLAWLPTPYKQNTYNQVLAVTVFNSMDSCYAVDKNYKEPYVIQFWDFGILNAHEKNVSKPSLLFGMAIPCGPIWHLEWCPSGCLDCFEENATYRLGLLAVAASDSCAYIYSIDNLPDLNDRGFIYKGEPVLKLQLESVKSSLEGQDYYPTRISWSKADGHRYIAVGYSTGLLALYDLQNISPLLQRGAKTGTNTVFPYKTFQAHLSSITALTLSHLGGGNKFLFSASFDRTSLFWDLTTITKILPSKKNNISDGVWMTQWPSYLVADDESSYNDKARAHSYYRALRYLMSPDSSCFTFAMSGINTLSYSDWLNTIIHGSNGGEVMAQITNRMFCNLEHKVFNLSYPKCIFSAAKLLENDGPTNDVAVTYDEAEKKYKVAFLDYNLKNIENTPNNFEKNKLNEDNLSECDIREYKLQSVNKVAFNPNPQACSYYAIGYQAGFVRLQWIEFISPLLKARLRNLP